MDCRALDDFIRSICIYLYKKKKQTTKYNLHVMSYMKFKKG